MSTDVMDKLVVPEAWTRTDLLGLEHLSAEEITLVLDAADQLKTMTAGCAQKIDLLRGATIANLFFENSTRTRTSFSLAARRLGADTIDFSSSGSSFVQGRNVYRYRQKHRGHECRLDCGKTSHPRYATSAGTECRLLCHQCG